MKKSLKLLALLLAMIMVFSAIPFAAADETVPADPESGSQGTEPETPEDPGVPGDPTDPEDPEEPEDPEDPEEPGSGKITGEITCSSDEVWPGQTISVKLDVDLDDYNGSTISWSFGGSSKSATYTVPSTASGTQKITATVTLRKNTSTVGTETFSTTISIKEPAVAGSFSISGPKEVMTNASASFSYSGENDSEVSFSVKEDGASITSSGKFRASQPGTYTVVATAKNGGSVKAVTAQTTITVTEAAYRVTMADRSFMLSAGTGTMSYSVTDADGNTVTGYTTKFSSSNASVASVDDDGRLTLKKGGTTDITLTVTIDGESYSTEATVTVSDKGSISCAQDGDENSGDSTTMRFVLEGVENADVDWTISVSGTNDFSVSDKTSGGTSASATITADDGIGIATVKVTADWGDSSASATFYTSFYNKNNVKVVLKDGVDDFDFDENNVFSRINGSSSNAAKKSLYTLMTDGCGTRVILSEDKSSNSRVGEITCSSKSTFQQYDPDDNNDYALAALEVLNFEVKGGGEYELDYEIYGMAGGTGYATSKGTITIITGEGSSDISYKCQPASSVKFNVEDFEEFWEDNYDDDNKKSSSSSKKNSEDLSYVTFDVATSSDTYGALYTNKTALKAAWKFYADYDDDRKGTYDLDEVTYKASTSQKSYTDEFTFICVGEDGTKISGIVSVEVANTTMRFADVSTSDWFYDEVYTVWSEGIMNGTSDTAFSPNNTLTRGMVVTMLYRMDGEPSVSTTATFTDVSSSAYYYRAVEWAADNDIVNGVGDGKFAPDTAITREQLAAILYRYAKHDGRSTSQSKNLSSFSDVSSVSDYATTALQWAVGAGIITGDAGKLMPQGNATRAQAAAMFARFMDLDEADDDDDDDRNDRDDDEDEDDDDITVYITPTGTKYHLDEDCAGKNARERDLSDVEDDYDPCSKCAG